MSKRIPDPPLPEKMTHYRRDISADDVDTIIKDSLRTAHKAAKHFKTDLDLIDGDFGKRRITALRNSISRIVADYNLTERTSGLIPTAEIWADLCLYPQKVIDEIDDDASLFLGAALWILDNVEDRFDLEQLLGEVDYEEDWTLPYFYDLNHTDPVIEAVVYILQYRYKYTNNFIDVDDRPSEAGEAFEKLMALLDPAKLRHTVATVRTLFCQNTDAFFETEYILAEKFIQGVENYNSAVDMYNNQVDRATVVINEFIAQRNTKRSKASMSSKASSKTPSKPGWAALAGSPIVADNPFAAFNLPQISNSNQPLSRGPLDFLSRPAQEPDIFERLDHELRALHFPGERAESLYEKIHALQSNMFRFVFDYAHCGYALADDYAKYYEDVELPTPTIPISDPYEACMGLLLLCSPSALRKIYGEIPGADVEADLDLPWLTGLAAGVARDIASHLPWGIRSYEEDEVEFRKPKKPLAHPDWFERKYEGDDGYKRSLSQILYETTGAVLPRDMNEFDDAHHILRNYGIRGKNEVHMAELMVLLSDPQYRTSIYMHTDPETEAEVEEDEPTISEDVEALQTQIKDLRAQLKTMTDAAHEQERRARKAEALLATEREKMASDRRELASLREVVFAAQKEVEDDKISVALPYEVKQRMVVFGGHDMWQKPMKEYLTGDVRFMDRNMVAFDTDVIKYASVVWIQTNAISHKMYYKIMDAARKHKIPVQYFLYASAKKCAEQVVLSEQE